MSLFKKLKEWATDGPGKPELDILEIFFAKGPTISVAAQIMRDGLPFHIRWKSDGIRDDN